MVTMQTPDVWVTSFVEATEVLQLNDGLVQAGYDEAKDSIFGGVLLTLDGDVHRTRRRIEQGLFTPRAVRWIDATLVPALITTEIGEQTRPSLIDLVTFSRRITTRLAAWLVGLGELNSPDSVDELSGLMSAMHSGVTVRWSTRPHAEVLAEADDAKRFYARRWFEPALALKREGGSGGASQSPRPEEPPTLLDVLLTHEDELHFSDEQYLRESVHFFIAAAHTASAALIHAVADLLEWSVSSPSHDLTTAEMAFFAHAAAESLRLHTPSASAFRVAQKDILLSTGLRLSEGQLVGIDLAAANRDPTVFGADAGTFDPMRKIGGSIPVYGLSFSAGAHNCPGRQLAAGTIPLRPTNADSAPPGSILGVIARIVHTLFTIGVEPAGESSRNTNTAREQYASFPLRVGH